MDPITIDDAVKICQGFALKHKVIFDDTGECGIGRECVGFRDGAHWIDHNPRKSDGEYEPIKELVCPAAHPPEDVNSYHKHDCLAVLGRGDEAIIELARWVLKMEAAGEVKVVEFETGATGLQAVLSGVRGRAVMISPKGMT